VLGEGGIVKYRATSCGAVGTIHPTIHPRLFSINEEIGRARRFWSSPANEMNFCICWCSLRAGRLAADQKNQSSRNTTTKSSQCGVPHLEDHPAGRSTSNGWSKSRQLRREHPVPSPGPSPLFRFDWFFLSCTLIGMQHLHPHCPGKPVPYSLA
jgi:hypothetical protein